MSYLTTPIALFIILGLVGFWLFYKYVYPPISRRFPRIKFFWTFFWKNRIAGFLAFAIWGGILILNFDRILKFSMGKEEGYIPDVEGMTKRDALNLLGSQGFSTEIRYVDYVEGCEENTVLNTYPKNPRKINKNRVVEVNIYKERAKVKVQRYLDLDLKKAQRLAKENKLKLEINYYIDGSDPIGFISRQRPPYKALDIAQNYVQEGSFVSVWICKERPPDEYIVPNVIGKSLNEAIKNLEISGFLIGDISYINKSNLLENTVYEISYITSEGYSVEILEGVKYTVPIRVDIKVTKDGE